ncbi:hypothetical protein BHE74_00036552 [Ensete ventricosum]|nr:hypothetical protein BHE74_00036552 [Ensete ventricosum]
MQNIEVQYVGGAPCVYHDASDAGTCNAGCDHQSIVVVWVFALGLEGESHIVSGSGPLLNLCVGICLPCQGANATHGRAAHNDVDVPFHWSLWTEGWLAWLPYILVEVSAVDKVLDLAF